MKRAYIIGEAGVNHDGSLETAMKLVDVASEAGVDAVKFQTFRAEELVCHSAPKVGYQLRTTGDAEPNQFDMLRRLQLAPDDYEELVGYCAAKNVEFLSTPFDAESARYLVTLGMQRIKIPSGEVVNLPFLREVGTLGKPVILSTGMATLGEVEAALLVLEEAGLQRDQITVLHCVSDYPAAHDQVNLRAMQTIAQALQVRVGYSDHTTGLEVSLAAVALGAEVIEKHFTLDRHLPGPDHAASLEPQELRQLVQSIRIVESSLGNGLKQPTVAERENMAAIRRSLVAAQPIQRGECIRPEQLTAKRPGTGMSPMRWDEVVGSVASRDYAVEELL